MSAIARSIVRDDGTEIHVATGHGEPPEGTEHEPEWGPWTSEWPGVEIRQCAHPDCDVDGFQRVG